MNHKRIWIEPQFVNGEEPDTRERYNVSRAEARP